MSAVHLAYEAGLWDQTWQLAEPLPAMFDWRADWRDWQETHRIALHAAEIVGGELGQAVMRRSLGMLYRELGRYDEAVAMFGHAAEIFSRAGDEHWAATV